MRSSIDQMSEMKGGKMTRRTKRNNLFAILPIFCLMAITLYMAFAFPFTLARFKRAQTTQLKSVIIIARNGEVTPTQESFYAGEKIPDELTSLNSDELTNLGKERMYLLGGFLKLRYYNLLLGSESSGGQKIYARACDSDSCLESGQCILAGLNPPNSDRDSWSSSPTSAKLAALWQPKAIHTTEAQHDDLLGPEANCFRLAWDKISWRNSSQYKMLLNSFRDDIQVINRNNENLFLDQDLEKIIPFQESLRTRQALGEKYNPEWYTNELADRLTSMVEATLTSRFNNSLEAKRLYVGRLLYEISEDIQAKVRTDRELRSSSRLDSQVTNPTAGNFMRHLWSQLNKRIHREPNVHLYVTETKRLMALIHALDLSRLIETSDLADKQQLEQSKTSSMFSLKSMLLIELHHDTISESHFLRFYLVGPPDGRQISPEILQAEQVLVRNSLDLTPEMFEQKVAQLKIDRPMWQASCLDNTLPTLGGETQPMDEPMSTTQSSDTTTHQNLTDPYSKPQQQSNNPNAEGPNLSLNLTSGDETLVTSVDMPPAIVNYTTASSLSESESTFTTLGPIHEDLDGKLLVGPANLIPSVELETDLTIASGFKDTTITESTSSSTTLSVITDKNVIES